MRGELARRSQRLLLFFTHHTHKLLNAKCHRNPLIFMYVKQNGAIIPPRFNQKAYMMHAITPAAAASASNDVVAVSMIRTVACH